MHAFPVSSIVRVPHAQCCRHQFFVAQQNQRQPYECPFMQQQVMCSNPACRRTTYLDCETATLATEDQLGSLIRNAILGAKQQLARMALEVPFGSPIDTDSFSRTLAMLMNQVQRLQQAIEGHQAAIQLQRTAAGT